MKKASSFRKITNGFVVQYFERDENGVAQCVSQEFVAGDSCDYETDADHGDVKVLDEQGEKYQPYDMVQPQGKEYEFCPGCDALLSEDSIGGGRCNNCGTMICAVIP